MKSKKRAAVRFLALTLVAAMLGVTGAYAEEYDSDTVSYTAGKYTYSVYSCVYIDSNSQCRGGTWMMTDDISIVPANYMGAKGRLYSQAGVLLKETGMEYNRLPEYYNYAVTASKTYSGLVYSLGEIELYTGTTYETHDAPQTAYAMSKSSPEFAATLDALKATLEHGNYPTNELGLTYGSALLAQVVGVKPDLISAIGTNDVPGYVRADDLDSNVSNPAEAAAYMAALDENRILPLYDVNGHIIGTFELSKSEAKGTQNMTLEEAQAAVEGARFPRNSRGETYGDNIMAQALGYQPDLVAAMGTEDQFGYVRNEDLNPHAHISTPEEAAAYMRNRPDFRMIPLYDQESNVIGVFQSGGSCRSDGNSFGSLKEAQAAMKAMGDGR